MNKNLLASLAVLALGVLPMSASSTKTYQVTGPVLEVSDTVIVVQKGDERWEIDRTPETKITGTLAKGAKVTIQYSMTATAITVK
jgi:hypothetical protein